MKPALRIINTLKRKDVDRVPYCEHQIDFQVAYRIAKVITAQECEIIASQLDSPGNLKEIKEFFEYACGPLPDARGDEKIGDVRLRIDFKSIELEKNISILTGRNNITYWGCDPPRFAEMATFFSGHSYIGKGLIADENNINAITLPELDDAFLETARSFAANKGQFAACAMIPMGIEHTVSSMGFENFCTATYHNPDFVMAVFGKYNHWARSVAEDLCKMEYDFIWAFDDIAFGHGPIFSPSIYRDLFLPELTKMANVITRPWIYHSDGNFLPLIDDVLSLGMSAIHPIEPYAMDIYELKKRYGGKICLVGNVDINTLAAGTAEEVARQVKEKLQRLMPRGGYLLSSSNSVASYCKERNVIAMLKALNTYGTYSVTP